MLLIDEIDRADDEFEAFLLEMLSDFQITIPEVGTIGGRQPPLVVLTSNRTRELHDALKRRCLYHWIDYPSAEREVEIVTVRQPGVSRGARAQGRRRRAPAARDGPRQAAWRRGDDRLGPHAGLPRRDDLDRRRRRPDPRLGASRSARTSSWSATTSTRSPRGD